MFKLDDMYVTFKSLCDVDYPENYSVELLSIYCLRNNNIVAVNRYSSLEGSTVCSKRIDLYRDVLKYDVDKVFMIHNHPRNTEELSEEDMSIERNLRFVLNEYGIEFLGSYIVTDGGIFSEVEGDLGIDINSIRLDGKPKINVMSMLIKNKNNFTGKVITDSNSIKDMGFNLFDKDYVIVGVNNFSEVVYITDDVKELVLVGCDYYGIYKKEGVKTFKEEMLLDKAGMRKVFYIVD